MLKENNMQMSGVHTKSALNIENKPDMCVHGSLLAAPMTCAQKKQLSTCTHMLECCLVHAAILELVASGCDKSR